MSSLVLNMDSTNFESNNNKNKDTVLDESYEDDFEKELDSYSEESSTKKTSPFKASSALDEDKTAPPPIRVSSPTEVEKGQQEVEAVRKESKVHDEVSDNESEPDADAYSFTEDQKRAMMELMVQKQEDTDLLDEEPPEYDVKDRIQQLNAELANDPTPLEGDREFRVGFKPEIVDLVAPPPPDYSDDESQPNSARGEPLSASFSATRIDSDSSEQSNKHADVESSNSEEKTKKQYVIERDGNFEVLSQNELTASERAMYVSSEDKKTEKQSSNQKTQEVTGTKSNSNNNNVQGSTLQIQPRPPAKARPNTATTSGPRRNVRPTQSPRPKSAEHASDSNTSLDNFNYLSPYAMTPEQKEQSREMSKKTEEMRRNREMQHQQEEKERRKENDSAFKAWMEQKREERRKNLQHNEDKQQTEAERKTENDEAYTKWLKEKRAQGKKDKLLKRRQHQEQMEGYFIRPRDDCERAFKEWLKKKNANLRKQHEMEKRQVQMYRVQVKRSKKTNALVRALKESQAFRYVDYYGYRY